MSRSIWRTLGISATHDQTAIRRAYAAKLRVTNPEDNPAGFQTLRGAYDQAMGLARHRAFVAVADEAGTDVEDTPEPAVPAPRRRRTAAQTPVPVEAAPAPVDERQLALDDLDSRCARLHALVTGDEPADDGAIREAGAAVLAAPALEEIAVHGRVDAWLQNLIAYNIPRGDPLIDMAAPHFGWAQQSGRLQTSGALEHILLRQDDLNHLRRLRGKDHVYRRPFRMLAAPPRRRSPIWRWTSITREIEVREFLRHLADAHPTIHSDLNQDSLAWWRERLSSPHFGGWSLILTLVIAGFGFLYGLGPALFGGGLLGGLAMGLIAGGATFGALLIRLYAFDVARFRWRRDWDDVAPDWVRLGWAPALLFVLLLAGWLPAFPPSLMMVGALTLAALLWARAVAPERPPTLDMADAYGPLLWTNAYLAPVWLLMLQRLEVRHALQVAIPLLALAVAGARNINDLTRYWRGLATALRQRLLMAVGGLIALAALMIALAGENIVLQAAAAALTGGIALALRVPAQPHPVAMLRVRYITNGALAVAGLMAGPILLANYSGSPWLVMSGALLLTGALMSLVVSAVAERGSRP